MARRVTKAELLVKLRQLEADNQELIHQNDDRQSALNGCEIAIQDLRRERQDLQAKVFDQESALSQKEKQYGQVLRILDLVMEGDLTKEHVYFILSSVATQNPDVLLKAVESARIDMGPTRLEKQLLAEVDAGRKIGAIKLCREATRMGLKDAKEFVEALQAKYR